MDVGTRDETAETSGAMLALKNTYLKTLKHTNETMNYNVIQMSGGNLDMDYDGVILNEERKHEVKDAATSPTSPNACK